MCTLQQNSQTLPSVVIQAMKRVGGCLSYCLSLASLLVIAPTALIATTLALPASAQSIVTDADAIEAESDFNTPEAINIAQSNGSEADLLIRPRYSINYREGGGFVGTTGVNAFFPLSQTAGERLFFVVGDLNVSNDDDLGGGVQSGYRALFGDSTIWGVYGGLDVRDTGNNTFTQAGLGAELIGRKWDLHLNANAPLGDAERSEAIGTQQTNTRFQDNQLQLRQSSRERVESALTTVSIDGSMQLWDWGQGNVLWGQGGLYYLGGADSDRSLGARFSLNQRIQDNIRLGLGIQNDGVFDTNIVLNASVSFGGKRKPIIAREETAQEQVWARAAEPLVRTGTVLVEERVIRTVGETLDAINPATGQAYAFRHVDPLTGMAAGSGTADDPVDTLTSAVAAGTTPNADNIIYVQAGDAGSSVTIPDGVQVRTVGVLQQIETQLGTVTLPGSGSGVRPTFSGTVTLGNNSLLSGLEINAGNSNGIVANGMNIAIEDNVVNSADIGINLPDVSGTVTVSRNQVSSTSDDGIQFGVLDEPGNTAVTVTDNQLTDIGGEGVYFDGITSDAIANVTVANNTISNTGGPSSIRFNSIQDSANATVVVADNNIDAPGEDGIVFGSDNNIAIRSSAIANITVSDNTVSGAADAGIRFAAIQNNVNASITVSDNTVSDAGEEGITFENMRGNAITNVAISNNNISRAGEEGINIARVGGSAEATIAISENTISRAAEDSIAFNNIVGPANATITLDGNTLRNSGENGISLESIRGNATTSLAITDNNIARPGTSEVVGADDDGVFISHSSNGDICLSLSDNTVTPPTVDGFVFESTGPGDFQIVDRLNVIANNAGSFDPADITTNDDFVTGTAGTAPCP